MSLARGSRRPQRLRDSPALQRLSRGRFAPPPDETDKRAAERTDFYFQRFRSETGNLLAAERFDAEAARLYIEATNPPVLADQSAIIRRLLERRRSSVSSPLVTSYEHQDPHFGRWVLSTLVFEDYGEFKIVNNSYIHLNHPPTTLPPHEHRIHLCWGTGWQTAPAASSLHAVVALLAEDWRVALSRLPVKLELHRLGPNPFYARADRGRRRWRDTGAPPAAVIAALFERANRVHALSKWCVQADSDGVFDDVRRANQWWCLCLFESDLTALGFARGADPLVGPQGSAWSGRRHSLPDVIEHVLVVPPQEGRGVAYGVRLQGDRMSLEPLRPARGDIDVTHYWNLRVSALDLVLDELNARMH